MVGQPYTQCTCVDTNSSEQGQDCLGALWLSYPVGTYVEAGQLDVPVAVPQHWIETRGISFTGGNGVRGPSTYVGILVIHCIARETQ